MAAMIRITGREIIMHAPKRIKNGWPLFGHRCISWLATLICDHGDAIETDYDARDKFVADGNSFPAIGKLHSLRGRYLKFFSLVRSKHHSRNRSKWHCSYCRRCPTNPVGVLHNNHACFGQSIVKGLMALREEKEDVGQSNQETDGGKSGD